LTQKENFRNRDQERVDAFYIGAFLYAKTFPADALAKGNFLNNIVKLLPASTREEPVVLAHVTAGSDAISQGESGELAPPNMQPGTAKESTMFNSKTLKAAMFATLVMAAPADPTHAPLPR